MPVSNSPAEALYNRRVLTCSAAYAVALLADTYLFKRQIVGGPLAVAAAILPALPIVAIFVASTVYIHYRGRVRLAFWRPPNADFFQQQA